MKTFFIRPTFFVFALTFQTAFCQEPKVEASRERSTKDGDFYFAPQVSIIAPIFVGIGPQLVIQNQFELSLLYGQTPSSFSSAIASVAASSAGNSTYKDVIEAAFQNNSQWRAHFQYNFNDHLNGWRIGFAYSKISANGKAGIDKVLQAATGADYTNLKNLLVAAGRSTDVDMETKMDLMEVNAGYLWQLTDFSRLELLVGATRVNSNSVTIKTGLSAFESTNIGKNLIATTESEIQSIVTQYGMSPTIGLNYSYFF